MLHLETKGPFDHTSRAKLIENSICYDYIGSRNGYVDSDYAEFFVDDIIEDPFEDRYGKFYLEQDVIIDKWKNNISLYHLNFNLVIIQS